MMREQVTAVESESDRGTRESTLFSVNWSERKKILLLKNFHQNKGKHQLFVFQKCLLRFLSVKLKYETKTAQVL